MSENFAAQPFLATPPSGTGASNQFVGLADSTITNSSTPASIVPLSFWGSMNWTPAAGTCYKITASGNMKLATALSAFSITVTKGSTQLLTSGSVTPGFLLATAREWYMSIYTTARTTTSVVVQARIAIANASGVMTWWDIGSSITPVAIVATAELVDVKFAFAQVATGDSITTSTLVSSI